MQNDFKILCLELINQVQFKLNQVILYITDIIITSEGIANIYVYKHLSIKWLDTLYNLWQVVQMHSLQKINNKNRETTQKVNF